MNPELQAWAFLNRADAAGHDNKDAMTLIRETVGLDLIAPRLGDRKAFPNAHTQGLAVFELKPRDQKAVKELESLYQSCFGTEVVSVKHEVCTA